MNDQTSPANQISEPMFRTFYQPVIIINSNILLSLQYDITTRSG